MNFAIWGQKNIADTLPHVSHEKTVNVQHYFVLIPMLFTHV